MIYLACRKEGVNFMFRKRVLVIFLISFLCCMITIIFSSFTKHSNMFTRMIVLSDAKATNYVDNDMKVVEVDTSSDIKEDKISDEKEEANTSEQALEDSTPVVPNEVAMPSIVYDGMTMDELASKLDRSLKNELSGKGYLYASYSLEKGVDPYLAVAISLEETGCNWNCSNLVKACNNVGGMKGSGCGSYGYFDSLDNGIRAFIDNIYKNYVAYGLTTANSMNSKYAENPAWSVNVNNYINRIKNN